MSQKPEHSGSKRVNRRTLASPGPERRSSDKFVLWSVAALAAFGVVAVYSAITFLAVSRAGMAPESFLYRHLTTDRSRHSAAMILFSRIDYHRVASWSRPVLVVSLGLLVLVQIAGVTTGGAERWLRIGNLSIQPSDIAQGCAPPLCRFFAGLKATLYRELREVFLCHC